MIQDSIDYFIRRLECNAAQRSRDGGRGQHHVGVRQIDAAAQQLLYLVRVSKIGKISKFLASSFSAASKRNFARKYAFDSIFQALQDLHPFAPLQSQNFRKKSV